MLISFLERGDALRGLSRQQMLEVETAFLLYLVKATTFREAFVRCERVLDDDQEHMRVVLKARLSKMIEDVDCNSRFKPAILRLAGGDDVGFRAMAAPTRRTRLIIDANRGAVMKRVAAVAHPLVEIGPRHLGSIEMEHIDLVQPHARRYVARYARFLTLGDSGTTMVDIVRDLTLLALRALRWYYPFLSGLHLTNTMRRTITNRGRGLVTYSVAGLRRRVVTDERGRMVNRESSLEFDSATNWKGWADDPSGMRELQFHVGRLARYPGTTGAVARFVLDPAAQEGLCAWLEARIPAVIGAADMIDAVRRSGLAYQLLLARFLKLPEGEVTRALRVIRSVAA